MQQGAGQQLLNQQQGVQQAGQGQFEGQQGQLNQQGIGQQMLQNQPMEGQQMVNQPMAGQQVLNQPMGGQQIANQPVGGQQQMLNQPIGGQQQVLNQPVGGQQLVQNQPVAQQQPVDGQNILQNQQVAQQGFQNQAIIGQQAIQNQPVLQQQVAGQQQFGNPNDLNVQNQQQAQHVPQQGQVAQPAVDAGGQLAGNLPVQNVQAGNGGNLGLLNPQGQHPIVPAQQVGEPAGIKQDHVGNIQQNIEPVKDQNIQGGVNNPAGNVANQEVGNKVQDRKDAIKDDGLRRRKRDLGNDDKGQDAVLNQNQNEHKQILHEADQENKVINNGETGNIQRDLREIHTKDKPFGDNVGNMIKSLKNDLYSDGNRKSPFVVAMGDTNLGVKRR